ncbi:MAG: aspartate-semialdehyde dehydrogenase [Candidatus Cloacimonetes bacterium]|jgi:aspartate-semialdehyde dehydrogenase|nr:aspartate-semialdehyde dehydrogenase [Candidatus Cloacimonadota bacterium]
MKLAVLGATGAVGRTILKVLEERNVPVDELVPLASARSAGQSVCFRGREWEVREPTPEAFAGCDIALFSAGSERSRQWAPVAADAGAVVIDNSSAWRNDPDVPLVVPEVNAAAVAQRAKNIIANPNCATIQLVVVLEAIRRKVRLRRVVATTFQSVSGAGEAGIAALRGERNGERVESPFVAPIDGNVIPWIGPRSADGWNEEEQKIRAETRRILSLPELPVAATCVRVPVEVGHSISATIELSRSISRDDARAALASMPGVFVCDEASDPLPRDVAGRDVVCVGHLRVDPDLENALHVWIVADNLRKGAATNAVQIAEAVLDA